MEHLTYVLGEEGVAFDESALWLLGKAAEGSMRDAMSLTDQAIAFGQGAVRHADVAAMLGTLDHRHILALAEALADVDVQRLLAEVAQLAEQGPDFAAVLDELSSMLHRLAVAQMVPDAVDNSHGDRDVILQLASRFTAEDIQLYYQIGIQGRGDMVHAPDLRSALEMTLLRMLAFRPRVCRNHHVRSYHCAASPQKLGLLQKLWLPQKLWLMRRMLPCRLLIRPHHPGTLARSEVSARS
ncbi:hypothetical protein HSBAA_41570 [Vreelandella sulfidaeris]|uniref:Uncharacterized protein n=1 Tax=Vreelandella sulfidaeris TaxID=115553 RepID=A0A455UE16_9GAMM|nr:hypothetical protein HSBAA_41570 [Halomonas sulfidaeris]